MAGRVGWGVDERKEVATQHSIYSTRREIDMIAYIAG
jgi:hypothetical protein